MASLYSAEGAFGVYLSFCRRILDGAVEMYRSLPGRPYATRRASAFRRFWHGTPRRGYDKRCIPTRNYLTAFSATIEISAI